MAYVVSQRGVRALSRLVRGSSSASTTTFSPATISPDAFPPPYTVRWSAAANSKDGAWVIWLGDRSRVLYHNGVSQQPSGVVPESALPTGWFRIRTVSASSTAVWLNVRTDSSTGAFGDAILSQAPGSATTGYDVASYCVATMAHDSTTGRRTVKQYVSSALVFGGAGGGTQQTATVVTAIALREVSSGNYQLQVKTTPLTFTGTAGSESAWTTVFETVPHSNNPIV